MSVTFNIREAAAIADVSLETIRTAMEKKVLRASSRRKTEGSVRYGFSVRDILFLKLLAEFPFALSMADKDALKQIVVKKRVNAQRWRRQGSDLIYSVPDVNVVIECKRLRSELAKNIGLMRWGKRRIISDPEIISGTPVFRGTRIALEQIAGLFRKNIPLSEIVEDYPRISERDREYAKLYARMGPGPGRPKKPIELRRTRKTKAA